MTKARTLIARALLPLVMASCVTTTENVRPQLPEPGPGTSASFRFDSLDDRPVASETLVGRPQVLVFFSVTSVRAQAEANFMLAMAAHDGPNVDYTLVSIDPAESRELVEIFRSKLHIPFRVAMADEATRAGSGYFGELTHEPVVIVLDRSLRPVFRSEGRIVPSDEIRKHLRGL